MFEFRSRQAHGQNPTILWVKCTALKIDEVNPTHHPEQRIADPS
jgi:hypothetical protein